MINALFFYLPFSMVMIAGKLWLEFFFGIFGYEFPVTTNQPTLLTVSLAFQITCINNVGFSIQSNTLLPSIAVTPIQSVR